METTLVALQNWISRPGPLRSPEELKVLLDGMSARLSIFAEHDERVVPMLGAVMSAIRGRSEYLRSLYCCIGLLSVHSVRNDANEAVVNQAFTVGDGVVVSVFAEVAAAGTTTPDWVLEHMARMVTSVKTIDLQSAVWRSFARALARAAMTYPGLFGLPTLTWTMLGAFVADDGNAENPLIRDVLCVEPGFVSRTVDVFITADDYTDGSRLARIAAAKLLWQLLSMSSPSGKMYLTPKETFDVFRRAKKYYFGGEDKGLARLALKLLPCCAADAAVPVDPAFSCDMAYEALTAARSLGTKQLAVYCTRPGGTVEDLPFDTLLQILCMLQMEVSKPRYATRLIPCLRSVPGLLDMLDRVYVLSPMDSLMRFVADRIISVAFPEANVMAAERAARTKHLLGSLLIPVETTLMCPLCFSSEPHADKEDKDSHEPRGGVFLPCFHYYHYKCIAEWLLINETCPMCRLNPVESLCSMLHPHHA